MSDDRQPDWDKLGEISGRVQDLARAGKLTKEAFHRLAFEASQATNGAYVNFEFLMRHAPAEVIEEMVALPPNKAAE